MVWYWRGGQADLVIPHAHQSLDQDVAVQQHEAAHELGGAGPALVPQPLTATHQLLMSHLHPDTHLLIHSLVHLFIHSFKQLLIKLLLYTLECIVPLFRFWHSAARRLMYLHYSAVHFIHESLFSF